MVLMLGSCVWEADGEDIVGDSLDCQFGGDAWPPAMAQALKAKRRETKNREKSRQ
jgi:hypothetical protein